jgi:hypothetical protein
LDISDETAGIGEPIEQEAKDALLIEMPMLGLDGTFDPEGLALVKQSFVDSTSSTTRRGTTTS